MAIMESKLKVIVAVHKPYDVCRDEYYLPVRAGAAQGASFGFQPDDEGASISHRNGFYCELTALYWAWKNLPAQALGLVHYRRYFGRPGLFVPLGPKKDRIASGAEILSVLERTPVILPKKRNYFIETRENQFVRAHGRAALDAVRGVLARETPAYLPAFERSMKRTRGHCFNMFIMRRDLADAYCAWLFDILFKTEEALCAGGAAALTARLPGFLAERLIDCWVETNGFAYTELPVVNMESQHWPKKATAFLMRKFGFGKRRKG